MAEQGDATILAITRSAGRDAVGARLQIAAERLTLRTPVSCHEAFCCRPRFESRQRLRRSDLRGSGTTMAVLTCKVHWARVACGEDFSESDPLDVEEDPEDVTLSRPAADLEAASGVGAIEKS